MEFFKRVNQATFWITFAIVLAVCLAIGGLIKYPGFLQLILISALIAVVGGFIGQSQIQKAIKSRAQGGARKLVQGARRVSRTF